MSLKFYAFLLLASMTAMVNAQTLFRYTNATNGAYNSIATNTTAVGLTRYNGASAPSSPCATGFSSTSFTTSTTYASTLPAIEADITASAGYLLSVTGFSAGLRHSGTGPSLARLAYSTNGGVTWIDQGTNASPNNGSCGATTTATWTTAFTVPSSSTLKFRIYAFSASGSTGTFQILNLSINGTVLTTDSIFTTATSFGPFCQGVADTISVPFSQSGGGFTGLFNVQLSDPSGIFPNDATSNIISTGSSTSPVTAIIPSSTAWANGYRVRVVNGSPTFYQSGDNGSNIVINQSVTPTISISAAQTTLCYGQPFNFNAGAVTNAGTVSSYDWYVNGHLSTNTNAITISLRNNDSVYALLTSNANCSVPASVASNVIVVTVLPTDTTNLVDTLCPGASISFGGQTLSTSGYYSATLTNINGCDSIVSLSLIVKSAHNTSFAAAICPGSSYSFNGRTLTSAGTYSDTVRCDSIVTLTLTYKIITTIQLTASTCQGTSYVFNGRTLTTAGTYSDTVRCDSIVTLTLTYKTIFITPLTASICQGTSYVFNGRTLTSAGSYSDTVRCDSIVTLTLSYKTPTITNIAPASLCQGESYQWHGHTYTTSGVYADTIRCDSIVTLTLVVNQLPVVSWNPTDTILQKCTSHSTILLSGGTPAGGTYSGHYVTAGDSLVYLGASLSSFVVTYTYVDAHSCANSDSARFYLIPCTGIIETNLDNNIRLYPNPAENLIHIDAINLSGIPTLTITDLLGKVIYTESGTGTEIKSNIDISALEKGVYFVTIRDQANNLGTRQLIKD